MIKIVLLIGTHQSGKTNTLKSFFRIDRDRLRPNEFISRKIRDKIFCAVSLSSPQELEDFCKWKAVTKRINDRIETAKEKVGEDFTMIIPFSIEEKDGKMNDRCVFLPIEDLKERFNVIKIILHRRRAIYLDYLKGKRFGHTCKVISTGDYRKHAKEIEKLIY